MPRPGQKTTLSKAVSASGRADHTEKRGLSSSGRKSRLIDPLNIKADTDQTLPELPSSKEDLRLKASLVIASEKADKTSLYYAIREDNVNLVGNEQKRSQNDPQGGDVNEPLQNLIELLKDRPDMAEACLRFIKSEITRPEYAKLSAELTEQRQDKIRERDRQIKARYRRRKRAAAVPATT